jgi:hypothetical protein
MKAFRVHPPPAAAAILNTCAVPLRRRMVNGALKWCEHSWWLVYDPGAKERTVICEHCKHSLSFPTGFLKGSLQVDDEDSPSAPNITGTGT